MIDDLMYIAQSCWTIYVIVQMFLTSCPSAVLLHNLGAWSTVYSEMLEVSAMLCPSRVFSICYLLSSRNLFFL